MKTASAKNKGRILQKWIVKEILTTFPSLESADVTSRSMGAQGVDVLLSPKAMKLFPFAVESKNRNSIAVYSWIEQHSSTKELGIPLVVAKGNHKEPIVVMYAVDFFNLMKENNKNNAIKTPSNE
jgi:hypothetical protein